MPDLNNFIEFTKRIIKRPAMYYISEVEDLPLIFFGYISSIAEVDSLTISNFLGGFKKFVNKHFKTKEDYRWDKLISLYSASDLHSIELFDRLFNEYIESLNKKK